MTEHNQSRTEISIVDAEGHLAERVERVAAGEAVILTDQGRPVAELSQPRQDGPKITETDIEWLRQRRLRLKDPTVSPLAEFLRMRDGD
jgi:antitoxin (DNA-binding transcriptional repressor) of toxin-antitoxin stability system